MNATDLIKDGEDSRIPELVPESSIDLDDYKMQRKQAKKMREKPEFLSKVYGFIREVFYTNGPLFFTKSDVQWLFGCVEIAAHEAGRGERTEVARFIELFERVGVRFKYTSKFGWEVDSVGTEDEEDEDES